MSFVYSVNNVGSRVIAEFKFTCLCRKSSYVSLAKKMLFLVKEVFKVFLFCQAIVAVVRISTPLNRNILDLLNENSDVFCDQAKFCRGNRLPIAQQRQNQKSWSCCNGMS